MQILTNDFNEIISYSVIGGLDDGIDIYEVPTGFVESFKPRRYVYTNNAIYFNDKFEEESEFVPDYPNIQPETNPEEKPDTSNESMFKTMIATLQKQSVQSNMNVLILQKENKELKDRLSKIEESQEVVNDVESNE